MNSIFVYGTLRKGRIESVMPEIAPYLKLKSKGYVKGRLFNAGEYPAALPQKSGNKKVYGEVLEVSPQKLNYVLNTLDEYEEVDLKNPSSSLFVRELTNVIAANGEKIPAWIYWYNKDVKKMKEIKDGIYRIRKLLLEE